MNIILHEIPHLFIDKGVLVPFDLSSAGIGVSATVTNLGSHFGDVKFVVAAQRKVASEVDIHIEVIVWVVDKEGIADDRGVTDVVAEDAFVLFVVNGQALFLFGE